MPKFPERLQLPPDKHMLFLCFVLLLTLSGCGRDTVKPTIHVSCNTVLETNVVVVEPNRYPAQIQLSADRLSDFTLEDGQIQTDTVGNAQVNSISFVESNKNISVSTTLDGSGLVVKSECLPDENGNYPTTETDMRISADTLMQCTKENEGGGTITLVSGNEKQTWIDFNGYAFYLDPSFPGVVAKSNSNDAVYYVNNLGELEPLLRTPNPEMIATTNPAGYKTTTNYIDVNIFNDTENTGGLVFKATCDVPQPTITPTPTETQLPTETPVPLPTATSTVEWGSGSCLDHCSDNIADAYKSLIETTK